MLLDVNVLVALAWPNHQFHDAARRWFRSSGKKGWCTCAITQLGFIRLSSNPAFTEHARTPQESAMLLARMTAHEAHRYLDMLLAPAGEDAWARTVGHRQTTDVYLALVARAHDTKLATFDARLAAHTAIGNAVFVLAANHG